MSVNIWPWVLGLALLEEDTWDDFVELGDQLEELVVGEVLEGELALALVTWVSLAKNGVSVT